MGILRNPQCSSVYNITKSTLMTEFGSSALPSQLLGELNIYFVYRDVIIRAESDFDKQNKGAE